MAYSDGYYYGQCKIIAVVDNAADNGKTVLITTGDNKTYSGTIANKKCEFLLPPRTLYTVQKVSSGSAEFTTKVEAGYGDCILVHLDTGYVEVKQGDVVGLDYIKAATDDNLKNKVPEAKAVKELNSSLTADTLKFQFATDGEGNYGYLGADDSFVPFRSRYIGAICSNSVALNKGKNYIFFVYAYNYSTTTSADISISVSNATVDTLVYSKSTHIWSDQRDTFAAYSVVPTADTTLTIRYSNTTNNTLQKVIKLESV